MGRPRTSLTTFLRLAKGKISLYRVYFFGRQHQHFVGRRARPGSAGEGALWAASPSHLGPQRSLANKAIAPEDNLCGPFGL